MKNVLILGGAGFIGSNLALKLNDFGYNVTVFDNLSKQIHGENPIETSPLYNSILDKEIRFVLGSVNSKEDLLKTIDEQDIIVNLAAETGTGQSMYEIQKYVNVNIGGTGLLLDILTNNSHSVKKIIVASSRAIYGEGKYLCNIHGDVYPKLRDEKSMFNGDYDCKCPICGKFVELKKTDEESKIHPNSIYGITKQNQEQMTMLMGKTLNIPSVALRYQNVYGPGQSLSNPYTGILSIFSNLILDKKNINVFEDGKESRDFVYIDDVVDATILALKDDSANHKVYNVGSNERLSVLKVANTLISTYNSKCNVNISGNFRFGDIRHNIADIKQIKKDINYNPKVDFNTGIRNFVNWVLSQKHNSNNSFETSLNELKIRGMFK